ncbi:MAG: flippase [Nanoarchaeota archaeon]|nr:flippase [Nanoarchaeota archaeon]
MTVAKKIAKNAGLLFTSEVLGNVFSFLLVIVISHYLGDNGFGKYSYAFAFVNVALIFSHLGMRTYLFREISKHPEKTKKFLDNAFTLRFFLTWFVYGIALVIAFFIPDAREIFLVIVLVMIYEQLYLFVRLANTVFNAHERNRFVLTARTLLKSLGLVFGAASLFLGYGLVGLVVGLIAVQLIVCGYSYFVLKKNFVVPSFSFDFAYWKTLVTASLPFWFTLVFQRIYYRIDTLMLGSMTTFSETGLYGASFSIVNALSFIPAVVITASFPTMSRMFDTNSRKQLTHLYHKVFSYLFTIGFPAVIGLTILADRIMPFVFGPEFVRAGPLLQILSWSVLFIFLTHLLGYLLNAIDKQKLFTIATVITAIANLGLNLMLIPRYGAQGAAYATVSSYLILFFSLLYFSSKHGYPLPLFSLICRPMIAGVAMSLVVVRLLNVHLLVSVAGGIVSFFGVFFLLGGLGPDEKRLLRSLLNK